MSDITTFLMFEGKAAEAIYVSLFPDSEIVDVTYYGENEGGPDRYGVSWQLALPPVDR